MTVNCCYAMKKQLWNNSKSFPVNIMYLVALFAAASLRILWTLLWFITKQAATNNTQDALKIGNVEQN